MYLRSYLPRTVPEKSHKILLITGVLLMLLTLASTLISPNFATDIPLRDQPVIMLVNIMVFSGAIYYFVSLTSYKIPYSNNTLLWILIVGVVLRVLTLYSTPMLENDYFRYLWDGAVLSKGIDPYKFSPDEIIKSIAGNSNIPLGLKKLAVESDNVIHSINHPHLRTIYPTIAQITFAIAHWIDPWSIFSWRLLLLVFDIATFLLLLKIFRILELSPIYLLIYCWNPLLVKEIYNSGHMDVIAFPFVLGALLLFMNKSYLWSVLVLSLSMGVKLWPLALMPLIIRPLLSNTKGLLAGLGLFLLIFVVLTLPYYFSGINEGSGLVAYGQSWQNNDSLFKLILWGSELTLEFLDINKGYGQLIGRIFALIALTLWIIFITIKKGADPGGIFERCLLIIAGIFLLSPTQFPWYYTWMLPFIAIKPRPSLLLFTVLLPLYYLRYYLEPRGHLNYFNQYVVWLESLPVLILLIMEFLSNEKHILKTGNVLGQSRDS